ncbi:MAG: hypothetical protein RLN60_04000 [Phycisphaerales bacterium]
MTARVVNILMLVLLLASPAMAQPSGCPHDADGDGRVDIEDLYHLTQNPADINGDGITDSDDTRCLEAYLRCVERLDMSFRPGEPAADGNVPSLSYRESGTSQVMRVVREPSPDGLGCVSQAWTTTLLGTRPGLSGPVEIRLDRDGFLWQSLFADASATSSGTTTRRGMLTCDGSGVEFVASSPAMTVASSSQTRALVLLHGQNITDAAVAKGVEDAADRSIGGGLIDTYTDIDGNVTLPTRGVLVLFELDAGDQANASFAFDDAVLLVETECGDVSDDSPHVFVLRDSIGPNNTSTNFNGALPGGSIGESDFQIALIQVTPAVDVVLTEFRAIIVGISGTYDVDAFDYELRLWDSFIDAQADPLCGQAACEYFFFEVPTVGPAAFGTAAVDIYGERPSYEVVFDLTGLGIVLTAGQTRHLGFTVISPGGNAGNSGVVESEESGPATDRAGLFNFGWFFTSDIPFRSHDGRYGMSLRAETLP